MQVRLKGLARAVLGVCCILVGCSEEPHFELTASAKKQFSILPGKIGVSLDSDTRKWQFVIQKGELSLVAALPEAPKEATHLGIEPFEGAPGLPIPTGYLYRGPYSISPDKQHVIASLRKQTSFGFAPDAFVIMDLTTRKAITQIIPTGKYAPSGFAWSADSRSIAVLMGRQRFWWWHPYELLRLIASHPISRMEFRLDVIDLTGSTIAQAKLVDNLANVSGEVIWTE